MRWTLQVVGGGSFAPNEPSSLSSEFNRPAAALPLDSPELPAAISSLAKGHSVNDSALVTPVLALRFESQAYLFNAPESTQRALTSYTLRLATKLRHIFLTGKPDWTRWGGLPGFLLTVADALPGGVGSTQPESSSNKLHVHGGDGITHCLGSMRWFVYRGSVSVEAEEYPVHRAEGEEAPVFDFADENIRMKVIVARSSSAGAAEEMTDNMEEEEIPFTEEDQLALEEEEELELACGRTGGVTAALDAASGHQSAGFLVSSSKDNDDGPAVAGTKRKASPSLPSSASPSDQQRNQAHAFKKQILATMFSSSSSNELHPLSFSNPQSEQSGSELPRGHRRTTTRLPHHTPSRQALSYLIVTPDSRGKFDPQKALSLGVKKGPLFGQLMRGNTVELEGGKVVLPSDVMGPTRLGNVLLLLDIPELDYLPSLLDDLRLKIGELDTAHDGRSHWFGESSRVFMIHMSKRAVVEDEGYWTVMGEVREAVLGKEFGEERVVHVVYHSTEGALIPSSATPAGAKVEDLLERTLQTYSPTFAKSTAVNYRLSAIDAGSFPNPIELAATYPPTESSNTTSKFPMIPALPLLEVVVEPFPPKLDLSSVPLPFSNAKRILEEEKKGTWGPILDRFLPQLRMKDDVPFIAPELPESAVEVWPLGTGSAAPSKYRNVSSTLVVLPSLAAYGQAGPGADENPTMFLDCGESTMGQLYRLLPFPDSRRHLKNLRFVFLSHLHADHQLGLVGVLKERWRLWREAGTLPADIPKVVLVAPWKYRLFLDEYSDLEEAGSIRDQSVFVESEAIVDPKCFGNDRKGAGWGGWKGPGSDHPRRSPYNPENLGELFASQGIPLKSFSAIPVLHCPSAFAGMATTLSGFRVSFSGDCRPSTLFAQVARGSDVLVHEATFEDGLESEALAKRHCTVGEAVAVGQDMQARFLLLTHFSQRYPKVPPLPAPPPSTKNRMLVAHAFDGTRIRMGSSDPYVLDRLYGSDTGRKILDLMLDSEAATGGDDAIKV